MIMDLYQEYLFVIGKLKDRYKLHIDVDHKDIHTFYRDKRPLFKLIFGHFNDEKEPSIVVLFHLDLHHAEAIQWFINIYHEHPLVRIKDSWIEDSNGEYYTGDDALALKEVFMTQEILSKWLETSSREEIEDFTKAKVSGRQREPNKVFDSQEQRAEAIIEFDRIKKPDDDESVH